MEGDARFVVGGDGGDDEAGADTFRLIQQRSEEQAPHTSATPRFIYMDGVLSCEPPAGLLAHEGQVGKTHHFALSFGDDHGLFRAGRTMFRPPGVPPLHRPGFFIPGRGGIEDGVVIDAMDRGQVILGRWTNGHVVCHDGAAYQVNVSKVFRVQR